MKKTMIIATVLFVLFACSKSVNNKSSNSNANNGNTTSIDCSSVAKSFSTDVAPIIQGSCASGANCHGAGSINGPGELIAYAEVQRANAQIRTAVLSGVMPKTGSLTTAQKSSIICWIDNGSTNN